MKERLSSTSVNVGDIWAVDADLTEQHHRTTKKTGRLGTLMLIWASIGVIYGDLGTSPLYVISAIFDKQPTQLDVLCATSLIFWSITLIVLVKYVLVVLWADDNGEGGTFALYATICRACGIPAVDSGALHSDKAMQEKAAAARGPANASSKKLAQQQHAAAGLSAVHVELSVAAGVLPASHQQPFNADLPNKVQAQNNQVNTPQLSWLGSQLRHLLGHNQVAQKVLLGWTLLMTGMVLGDGVLTPSISVLSAVSGLQVKAGLTNSAVTGITCAILVVLFAIQSWGTQRVGVLFAPTAALWFLSNVMVGIYNIVAWEGGGIFRAISPHYIVIWFQRHGGEGWKSMAGVFLCLTGCEAMFADLGHFNRQSIQLSFSTIVYPSLVFTYFGQASFLMHNPDGYSAVFYNSIPAPVFWPIFIISVLAAIVASQALITGAFSLVYQSMAMGCFPRFRVHHTSAGMGGQIYIPAVNYTLMGLCVAVVAGFQSSVAIGDAYGVAVSMVMFSTVILVSLVMLLAWGYHPLLVMMFFVPFIFIEGMFLGSNLLSIPRGGWFSLTLAVAITLTNALWIWGTSAKAVALRREESKLSDLFTTKPPGDAAQAGHGCGLSSQGWRLFRKSNGTPVHRNPGMALVYSESPSTVPAVFQRLMSSWGLHSIVVFLTVRQVPIPYVRPEERLILAPLELKGFYKCVARYGYMDKVDQGERFAQSVLDKLAELTPGRAMSDALVSQLAHPTLMAPDKLANLSPKPDASGHCKGVPTLPSAASAAEDSRNSDRDADCRTGGALMAAEQRRALAVPGALASCDASAVSDNSSLAAHAGAAQGAAASGDNGTSQDDIISYRLQMTAVQPGLPMKRGASLGLELPSNKDINCEHRITIMTSSTVSDLAARAVYVFHRPIINVQSKGGGFESGLRKFFIEGVYQQLWHLTARFWESWHVPADRMFEVGMVLDV